jgi:site-specific DNA recombinase
MIKRITVYEGYKLDVEMNMNVQQFLNGLEATAKQKIAS